MHEMTRETLTADLAVLLSVDRNDLDMLVITPRRTSSGLIVMVRDGKLQLIYVQAGRFDFRRAGRFWLYSLSNHLPARFERWGKELIHRVTLGSDPIGASARIDDFFAAVYKISGHSLSSSPVWAGGLAHRRMHLTRHRRERPSKQFVRRERV